MKIYIATNINRMNIKLNQNDFYIIKEKLKQK